MWLQSKSSSDSKAFNTNLMTWLPWLKSCCGLLPITTQQTDYIFAISSHDRANDDLVDKAHIEVDIN